MNKKKIVLIIEDDAPLHNALHDKLVREGFIVSDATNGQEGLALALREHPDVLMLDLGLPVMDGMTMLKKLRQDAWGKNAAVIILTNLTSNNVRVNQYLTQSKHVYFLEKNEWKIEDVLLKVRERLAE